MKAIITATASVFALMTIVPGEADAAGKRRGVKAGAKQGQAVRVVSRSASTSTNGLCQRDNGTPMDKLNFRNKCDVEEFWTRIMERSGDNTR